MGVFQLIIARNDLFSAPLPQQIQFNTWTDSWDKRTERHNSTIFWSNIFIKYKHKRKRIDGTDGRVGGQEEKNGWALDFCTRIILHLMFYMVCSCVNCVHTIGRKWNETKPSNYMKQRVKMSERFHCINGRNITNQNTNTIYIKVFLQMFFMWIVFCL